MTTIEIAREARAAEVEDVLARPQFTTAQVARATGVPAETIRTWFKRGILSLAEDNVGVEPESIGLGRQFTGYSAMAIAIMGRLVNDRFGGMQVSEAKSAAYKFVFAGDEDRRPCHLYPTGETIMLIKAFPEPFGEGVSAVYIHNHVDEVATWRKVIAPRAGRTTAHVQILRLDELWQSVFHLLGIRAELEG